MINDDCCVCVFVCSWFTQLDSTRWLHHLSNLIRASWYTAVNLEDQGRPVLVHCSDGWDRTPQIVSLAQLMIDPFYRTVKVTNSSNSSLFSLEMDCGRKRTNE